MREHIPDPQAPATFASAKLDWEDCARGEHAETLAGIVVSWTVRKAGNHPLLLGIGGNAGRCNVFGNGIVRVTWKQEAGDRYADFDCNLSGIPAPESPGRHRSADLAGSAGRTKLARLVVRAVVG